MRRPNDQPHLLGEGFVETFLASLMVPLLGLGSIAGLMALSAGLA